MQVTIDPIHVPYVDLDWTGCIQPLHLLYSAMAA